MTRDEQVQHDVLAELKWEPTIDATGIGVEVTDGVVTLTGQVGTYAQKLHAESAAQRVSGVEALAVNLKVKLPGPSQRTDADIGRTARDVLLWNDSLPRDAVKVLVENGWITLSGTLDWEFQRRIAREAVCHLMGVVGVSDRIAITPHTQPGEVTLNIESTLRRRAWHGRMDVAVEAIGGDVTLSGSVHNWSDRELARDAALGTAGVRSVTDNIALIQ